MSPVDPAPGGGQPQNAEDDTAADGSPSAASASTDADAFTVHDATNPDDPEPIGGLWHRVFGPFRNLKTGSSLLGADRDPDADLVEETHHVDDPDSTGRTGGTDDAHGQGPR